MEPLSLALLSGVVLGLSAGLAPGPLLTLVIVETVRHGTRAGIKVSFSPLVTDVPIVCASIFIISRISEFMFALGIVSLFGAVFVAYLGVESLRVSGIDMHEDRATEHSLMKGVITNFLNPHPYLFWISVGAPMIVEGWGKDIFSAGLFMIAFYVLLVGSKVMLALGAGQARAFLLGRAYTVCMKILGGLLVICALLLAREALCLLKILQ
ncbi:MAG: LysE family translocator [Desulfomonilia bacterium]